MRARNDAGVDGLPTINQLLNCAAILFVDHRCLSCHGLNWEMKDKRQTKEKGLQS